MDKGSLCQEKPFVFIDVNVVMVMIDLPEFIKLYLIRKVGALANYLGRKVVLQEKPNAARSVWWHPVDRTNELLISLFWCGDGGQEKSARGRSFLVNSTVC
jgi:hypothetical protein